MKSKQLNNTNKNLNRRHRRPATEEQVKQETTARDTAAEPNLFFSKNLIQPKMKTSQPGDSFEKEADAMAENLAEKNVQTNGEQVLQKEELKEEEKLQTLPEMQKDTEKEGPEEEPIQASSPSYQNLDKDLKEDPGNNKVDLQPDEKEEEVQMAPEVQMNMDKNENEKIQKQPNYDLNTGAEKRVNQNQRSEEQIEPLLRKTKGSGYPLPVDIRMQLESEMKADFSKVRIHTGKDAGQLAAWLKAQAFTHGYDIYFNKGKYQPGTKAGRRLLIHELTHVIQQKGK